MSINWKELDRRHRDADISYQIVETIRAGTRAARAYTHCLERYGKNKWITRRQEEAGMRLYNDFVISQVQPSASKWDGMPIPDSVGSSRSITDRQLDASRRYTKALLSLPMRASVILSDVIICEMTIEQAGNKFGLSRKEAMGALKISLDMLGDYWRLPLDN